MADKKYTIRTDRRTVFTVLEHQLYKARWVAHFGSIEAVDKFIKSYK
jgi:hypothetical protein